MNEAMSEALSGVVGLEIPAVPRANKVSVFHKYYLPEDGIQKREDTDRAPYRQWAAQGWLTLTPGNRVDYDLVRADIRAIWKRHNIGLVAMDPKYGSYLMAQLEDVDKIEVRIFDQHGYSIGSAMRETQRLIETGQLEHEMNPITAYQRSNVQVKFDRAGNPRPTKTDANAGSLGTRIYKIDGITAMCMAVWCAVTESGKHKPGAYTGRGLRVVGGRA